MGAAISSSTPYSAATPADTSTAGAVGTSGYASRSDHVHKVGDNSVSTASIQDNAITSAKIAAGAVNTWSVVAEQTLGGAGTISFTSIASGYKHMWIHVWVNGCASGTSVQMRFNSDATNYLASAQRIGTTTGALNTSTEIPIAILAAAADKAICDVRIAQVNPGTECSGAVGSSAVFNGSSNFENTTFGGYFNSTTEISRIDITGAGGVNLSAGAHAVLYGLKA